jgi:RNA polymerase sigma-70 factor, ECF subfamily
MARAAAGDRTAWRILYERHRDFVHGVALRFLGDDAAARDVAQDVFVAVLSRAAAYRPSAGFATYLRRVTVHRCLNERASARNRLREKTASGVLEGIPSRAPDPEASLARSEADAAVRAAVAALPDRQRMAVILARFEGLSGDEIAAALGCSASSVESLLFRARQTLARVLAATWSGSSPEEDGS